MPVREAKGRILVREYMADREFMREFTAEEREAYLLLSLFTDDGGWLQWDVGELAAAMYRYEPLDARESTLSAIAEHLTATGRLKVYRCGHAVMPKVAQRPRGMKREYAIREEHQGGCAGASRKHSQSSDRAGKSSQPPDLTKPNLTSPDPTYEGKPLQPSRPRKGGRANGGPTPIGASLRELAPLDPALAAELAAASKKKAAG